LLKFPKIERYSLGQIIQTGTLDLIENVVMASQTSDTIKKYHYLGLAHGKLEVIKLLIRLSSDTNSLSDKRYIKLESELHEIGKMLGGWIRSTKN